MWWITGYYLSSLIRAYQHSRALTGIPLCRYRNTKRIAGGQLKVVQELAEKAFATERTRIRNERPSKQEKWKIRLERFRFKTLVNYETNESAATLRVELKWWWRSQKKPCNYPR